MSIINPLSQDHHAWKDLASYMKCQKGVRKVGGGLAAASIVFSSVLAGVVTLGIGAPPTFRWMVKHLVKSSDQNPSRINVKNTGTSILFKKTEPGITQITPSSVKEKERGLRDPEIVTISKPSSKVNRTNGLNDVDKLFKTKLYDELDKDFADKVLIGNTYSPDEKNLFSSAAFSAYRHYNQWLHVTITIAYFDWLAFEQPDFSTVLSSPSSQFNANNFLMDQLLDSLPSKIDVGPRIYGHAIRINENHRAGFVIDMDTRTVEYFNSFGSDTPPNFPLVALAKALSQRYGVNFDYHNRTEGISLQPDSFQCGIWACKLVGERFKQGKNFDPASLRSFNIAQFRNEVYAAAHKYFFFRQVGVSRFNVCLKKNIDMDGSEEVLVQRMFELEKRIYDLLENKLKNLDPNHSYLAKTADRTMDFLLIKWGRDGDIPNTIKDLVEQAKAL